MFDEWNAERDRQTACEVRFADARRSEEQDWWDREGEPGETSVAARIMTPITSLRFGARPSSRWSSVMIAASATRRSRSPRLGSDAIADR